ncbi:hypothetical protein Pla108_19690 [Botrimarina colliarenosi]|uniref:YcxB-like protein domain-containing protein n=1 Tax=Botrimarina colliarenosi TaxID=2528001 RepID=A0A5C6AEH7_9BACT|nr:hypothetical protein [Botrimarina colliarenosi]TWT97817.1 hypothetical protein Pla108_19690 [Botrimarina colliarenosi]
MTLVCPAMIALYIDEPVEYRLAAAGVFAFAIGVLYPRYFRSAVRRGIQKRIVEANGSEGPYELRYVIDGEGIEVEQEAFVLRFPWAKLVETLQEERSIDLAFEKGGFVRIANRAFVSDAQRQEFLALVTDSSKTV